VKHGQNENASGNPWVKAIALNLDFFTHYYTVSTLDKDEEPELPTA